MTHGFRESENYLRVFEFLESVDQFYYVNVSRPDASVQGGLDELRDELIAQIKQAEAAFVLPDLFEQQPGLVNFMMLTFVVWEPLKDEPAGAPVTHRLG